VRSDTESR